MKPQRIQRKRSKGWRMPDNTVYVGRGSRWGNPFRPGHMTVLGYTSEGKAVTVTPQTVEECIKHYINMLVPYRHVGENSGLDKFYISEASLNDIKISLRGKNLCCWCKPDEPCHADFLLGEANAG